MRFISDNCDSRIPSRFRGKKHIDLIYLSPHNFRSHLYHLIFSILLRIKMKNKLESNMLYIIIAYCIMFRFPAAANGKPNRFRVCYNTQIVYILKKIRSSKILCFFFARKYSVSCIVMVST